jgi:hypothetical protein
MLFTNGISNEISKCLFTDIFYLSPLSPGEAFIIKITNTFSSTSTLLTANVEEIAFDSDVIGIHTQSNVALMRDAESLTKSINLSVFERVDQRSDAHTE